MSIDVGRPVGLYPKAFSKSSISFPFISRLIGPKLAEPLISAVGAVFAGPLPGLFGGLLQVAADSALAYRAVLITSVLLGTSAVIPIWIMREPRAASDDAPASRGTEGEPPSEKPSSTLTMLIAKMSAPQLITGFGAAILIPYMNVFFKDRFDISDELLGFLFSGSSLLIGVGSILGPRLSSLMGGKIKAVVFTQFTSLVFLLTIGFSPFLWLSSVGFLVRSALMNMSAPLYSAFCMEHTPERQQGYANSVLSLSWNIGWAVGPYISGLVQERYGFSPLFITTSILYFISIALTWHFFVRMESHKESATA